MARRWQPTVLCFLAALFLGGCSPLGPQHVERNSDVDYHIVHQGDTLYSIAWSLGYDYKQVAAWNGISAPYRIYIGQRLRIVPPAPHSRTPSTHPHHQRPAAPARHATKVKSSTHSGKGVEKRTPHHHNGQISWRWPVANGKVVQTFEPKAGKKGVDIRGKPGEPVYAAAGGDVVYSGNGLIGYGNLVIIKHNDTYLSAYAYNRKLLVREGDSVKAGTKIAEMGQDPDGESILHFEIRRDGNPINPMRFLPRRGR